MQKFLLDILTDHDGDADVVSTLGILSAFVMIGLTVYTAVSKGTFDAMAFGGGVGMILGGLGGGYFAKAKAA